jgi:hypothetical protein
MSLRDLAKTYLAKAESEQVRNTCKAHVVPVGQPYTCPTWDNASVTIYKALKQRDNFSQVHVVPNDTKMGQHELKYSAFETAGTSGTAGTAGTSGTAGRAPDSSRLSAAEDVVHEAFRAGIEIRPIGGKITVKTDGPISDSLKSRLDEYWPAIEALLAAEAPNSATSAFVNIEAAKALLDNPDIGVTQIAHRLGPMPRPTPPTRARRTFSRAVFRSQQKFAGKDRSFPVVPDIRSRISSPWLAILWFGMYRRRDGCARYAPR